MAKRVTSKALGLGTALCAVLGGQAGLAQTSDAPLAPAQSAPGVSSVVLTLDQEQMFRDSLFGQRIQAELEAEQQLLASENRRIETELIAEEQSLTDRRASLPVAEFSELALAFDAKVQRIRAEQDSKVRQFQSRVEEERAVFVKVVGPILQDLMRQRGAAAIVDDTVILLAVDGIDITEDSIALIDATIGDGATVQPQ